MRLTFLAIRLTAWIVGVSLLGGRAPALEVHTLMDNGPSRNRIDMFFLGEGYRLDEQDTFAEHVSHTVRSMVRLEEPFTRYRKYFNAHRIHVISRESGVDEPDVGIARDTALDGTFGCGNNDVVGDRTLCIDLVRANDILIMAADLNPASLERDMLLVSVNTERAGGSGGRFAVYSGAHPAAHHFAMHELGHSFSGLADEYGGIGSVFPLEEPTEVNVTTDPSAPKWGHWLGYHQPDIGKISTYEGGAYFDLGIYRPSEESKMRNPLRPFDAVSREKMILDIYDRVDPLDAWTDTDSTVVNPAVLEVFPIDPEIIEVEWIVDGVSVGTGTRFEPRIHDLAPGLHEVTAVARDPTDWVRIEREKLEQSVTWQIDIRGLVSDLNGDGAVDALDAGILFAAWGGTDADITGDGITDAADAGILFTEWTGDSVPVARALVPEPTRLRWLLLLSSAVVANWSRRRRAARSAR